ncbi:hypothetical protein BBAD15_g7832 [Beauveria bassiana D1-5]|uniref:Aminoglycoside phosphotransferase domain-containing protein n=1 Tax=Beauveria bassiana D1-5 TaxID=1245745 RepID=A0A0A2W1K6_BEABA|nr:hypothetical protein BBAD15_g7832 [Beauveria bassiana D1-5]
MLSSLDILTEASRLRSGVPCSLADESPHSGHSHRVFKIVCEDSVIWAARTSQDVSSWKNELRAVKDFLHVKQHRPNIKAPDIYFRDDHPIIYSEWVGGAPLAVWNFLTPLIKRQRLLDDLADFLLQLWTVPAPPASALAQPLYSTWLTDSLDRGLRRTLAGTAKWGDAINYLIMRSMISKYAEQFDSYSGIGFAHGDLNAYNIMKSDDFHLTGWVESVVDWDWMYLAPLPVIIHHPWFIADIPGWKNDGVGDGDNFAEDRLFLENAIKSRELSQQLPPVVSTLLTGSEKRLFFQSAFHFKDIHENFVRLHCPRTEENIKAAKFQLAAVLSLYPELGCMEGPRTVRNLLEDSF